jgi:hypothetical protein
MKKFLPILALLLVIALGGVFFFKKHKQQEIANNASGDQSPSTTTSPGNPPNSAASTTGGGLEAKDQSEITKCLGAPAKNMEEFKALVESKISVEKEAILEWKNVHFTDGEGKKFRLRLEKETSESGKISTRLKLFSVDAEDLPDPIKVPEDQMYNPSERVIQSYLDGKNIALEQELNTVPLADGGEMRLETENGKPVSLELESKTIKVACASKFQSSCRCFSAAN